MLPGCPDPEPDARAMRAAAVLVLAAAAAGQDSPTCFAKPADACANLLWATENNKTMSASCGRNDF